MPADYNSTARALALPISPPRSPTHTHNPIRKSWPRSRSSQSVSRTRGSSSRDLRDNVLNTAQSLQRKAVKTISKMTLLQRLVAGGVTITLLVLTILFFIYNERIFAWLKPIAEKWKALRGGWLILFFMTCATAFPPVIGYSTCVTIAGFVYGFPNGWFIAASANVVGSFCSFLVSRTILASFVDRLVSSDPRFTALALVLKHDGLKLLVMIRLCPLPYSLSNGAMATFPTVSPLMFAGATALASPKLLIHVFIGSRLRAIAQSGEKMDGATKAINYVSIAGGMTLGILTGWFIYRRTVARSRELEAEERAKLGSGSRPRGLSHPDEFVDELEGEDEGDDIDFLGAEEEYQDESEGEDEFSDGDEEMGAIGMDTQPSRR